MEGVKLKEASCLHMDENFVSIFLKFFFVKFCSCFPATLSPHAFPIIKRKLISYSLLISDYLSTFAEMGMVNNLALNLFSVSLISFFQN